MITRAGPVTADPGAGCDARDDLRRVGSKTSTHPGAWSAVIGDGRAARFVGAPAHSVTATARRTKAGKQAAQKTDERAMIRTL